MDRSIWIGWEPREVSAFAVAKHSIISRLTQVIPVFPVVLQDLMDRDIYHRPLEKRGSQLYDLISAAPMATEFAVSRFFVPILAKQHKKVTKGPRWALFIDCDMMIRTNMARFFETELDPTKAVMVVKHKHVPTEMLKMDNQIQTFYHRKNWSSVCAFNLDHPSNDSLTLELLNSVPGRDLHAFCWLKDEEIGSLDMKWNHLVGYTENKEEPAIVHFTDGIPYMPGYENVQYADEWREELLKWAQS